MVSQYFIYFICEKDQKDAQFYFPYFFQLYYPLCVSNKPVHHQDVTSVHAAYSIFHARI